MIYLFIFDSHTKMFPVAVMCDVLECLEYYYYYYYYYYYFIIIIIIVLDGLPTCL